MRQVVILHGWSDDSKSFKPLARFLKRNGYNAQPLYLGDYISLRDEVKIDDVVKAMARAIELKLASGQLTAPFDLIVHSTGGLVVRRWISRHYADGASCPAQNVVMLAPANFGSPLAHMGRSLIGRVAKGLGNGFETGAEMLHALELGSEYQWALAQDDLFVPEGTAAAQAKTYYGPQAIKLFVITGTHPYTGLANFVSENGSDGTIRVTGANMNARGMTVDFSGGEEQLRNPKISQWKRRGSPGNFPLAVLPDRDHSSIVDPGEEGYAKAPEHQRRLGQLILDALSTNTALQYARRVEEWRAVSMETRTLAGNSDSAVTARNHFFKGRGKPAEHFHEYYQLNVRAVDEFGEPVPDYFMTFMHRTESRLFGLFSSLTKDARYFQDEVLQDVHLYGRDNSYRCFHLDRYDIMKRGGFYDLLRANQPKQLSFTMTANDPGDRVSYFSRRGAKRGLVLLHKQSPPDQRWLKRHCTHFIKVIVPRIGSSKLFKLKKG